MVEQICEKCGMRYSMYAPCCPSCSAPSTQPPKKPGCPQAPAPAPRPAKPTADEKPKTQASVQEDSVSQECQTITVEGTSKCPCGGVFASPLALVGIVVAALGVFKLLRR